MRKIRKAVFPVAGLGSRFLPATKANPKEMLPIVDKPLIQYAAEEAIQAGITELIFVTSTHKRAIEDHFDSSYELEAKLIERNKTDLLAIVQNILPTNVSCTYVRQKEALGLGHAILCAKNVVGDEPFAILLADDLIHSKNKICLERMVEYFQETGESIIAVEKVQPKDTERYGIIAANHKEGEFFPINNIAEKPKQHEAPSNLGVVGRYILTPRIFNLLEQTHADKGNEIQLTDAIAKLIEFETINAMPIDGKRFDCGQKLGYLEATLFYATFHPELGPLFKKKLSEFIQQNNISLEEIL